MSVSVNASIFFPSTVLSSSYLLINHGNKSRILFSVRVMHKYTLVKITANYDLNIVSNYLINTSENVVCTLITHKLKL